MSKKPHTRHHFIPQCYLRNFAYSDKGIYAYDKIESKSYSASIDKVCAIDNFYSVSPENVDSKYEGDNPTLIIEKDILAENIEYNYAMTINNIIQAKDELLLDQTKNIGLCYEDKYTIAQYIAIQFLRLKSVRDEMEDMYNEIMPKAIRLLKQGVAIEKNDPAYNDLNIGYKYDPTIIHANLFLDNELIDNFAKELANNYWSFYVSEDNEFYTSDFPIIVQPHVQGVQPMCMGLTQYGAEVTFPISKDIVLTIWDKDYFSDKAINDCKFIIVEDKEIRRQNLLRLFYAKRNVFSYHNNFIVAETFRISNGGNHVFLGTNK